MKLFSALICLLLIASPAAFARINTYTIDSSKSTVAFTVLRGTDPGLEGTFKNVRGSIRFDDANIAASSINALVPTGLINTGIGARDTDLTGAKYFDCAKFPQAAFQSKNITKTKDGKLLILGFFQLHGIKKPLTIKVNHAPHVVSKNGKKALSVAGTTAINQEDFGLNLLKLHPDGFVRIDKMIEIKLSIVAEH
ncbi:MAG: polyisoprenoid-binding protein [Candidatus Melainabacteria bacterium]|nr:polyisoprenoid-binding protein [Candidatus Melainabacteria bacterium]